MSSMTASWLNNTSVLNYLLIPDLNHAGWQKTNYKHTLVMDVKIIYVYSMCFFSQCAIISFKKNTNFKMNYLSWWHHCFCLQNLPASSPSLLCVSVFLCCWLADLRWLSTNWDTSVQKVEFLLSNAHKWSCISNQIW